MERKKKANKLKHPPYVKFKAFLVENSIRQNEIASLLKLAKSTINQKINGYLDFEFNEIEIICDEYNISSDIFRASKISRTG